MGFLDFLICAIQWLFMRLLHKYYPNFVEANKKQPNRLDIRQFLVFSYG